MKNPKLWCILLLNMRILSIPCFLSCGEVDSTKKGDWQVKILSVKNPQVTVNGIKQKIAEQLDIEFELTYSGSDSSIVDPSDFALIDSKGNEYGDPTLSLPTQSAFSSTGSGFFQLILRANTFNIGSGKKITKAYRFSISDESIKSEDSPRKEFDVTKIDPSGKAANKRKYRFRFKDLPAIPLKVEE